MSLRPLVLLTILFAGILASNAHASLGQEVHSKGLPAAPVSLDNAYAATLGGSFVIVNAVDSQAYSLAKDATEWATLNKLPPLPRHAASAVHGSSLIIIGGEIDGQESANVTRLSLGASGVEAETLPQLPAANRAPSATVNGSSLIVTGQGPSLYTLDLDSATATWTEKPAWEGEARSDAFLVKSVETISLIGGISAKGETSLNSLSYHTRYGWSYGESSSPAGTVTSAVKLGDAHAATTIKGADQRVSVYLYHMIGDTWITLGDDLKNLPADTQAVAGSNEFFLLSQSGSHHVTFGSPKTNYGWWDHLSVGVYFLIMLYIGVHFAKQSTNSQDYFRGGNKIPWWATGMSLFATGASAMSLMAMPGKAYASNWTFFAISIYSILALPISMYFFAPIVRKLNFGTAFEYLERRFGLSVRIIGSTIFAVYQILGRMGGVLLLPSFALEAIAGIPMQVSVPIMGLVTIAYTFLGGLSAVIWTDTIQGFVMIAAVAGCLILVFFKIDMPFSDVWTLLGEENKLHVFDWGISLTQENVFTVFIGIVAVTMLGIGDQNYVQRVQCGPSLTATKKAIATQMGVAVPINILLFALGTALFIFYKQAPEALNPVMRNDGIYPFFAAQQLPPGASGLVIAALLAATMSTISSSICSVSNLAVDDFYKRFSKAPSEKKAVSVGRVVTVLVGLFGIASAFYLNSFETPSIWDLALRVVSIVTATTVGTYALGLFSKQANEIGVLVGIACGMGATYWISAEGLLIFWLYPVAGSLITYAVGLAVSIATGGNKKNIDGLTLATLKNRSGGLDD